jgi:hypothetical protein
MESSTGTAMTQRNQADQDVGSERRLWKSLKRSSFHGFGLFPAGCQLRLGEARTAPKEENPNPRDRRKANRVYTYMPPGAKMEIPVG